MIRQMQRIVYRHMIVSCMVVTMVLILSRQHVVIVNDRPKLGMCVCVLINPIVCYSTHMALLIVFKGIVGVDAYAVAYAWKQAGIAVCLCWIYL
jgi:hypothetical protein